MGYRVADGSRRAIGDVRHSFDRGRGCLDDGLRLAAVVPIGQVPARVLGSVECLIGPPDQDRWVLVRQSWRDADAGGYGVLLSFEADTAPLDGLPDAVGGVASVFDRTSGEYGREFLAAMTGHDIRAPHRLMEDARDVPQHFVPGAVPMAIVEIFEAIDIGKEHRERPLLALVCGEAPRELLVEGPSVGQAGSASVRDSALCVLIRRACSWICTSAVASCRCNCPLASMSLVTAAITVSREKPPRPTTRR